MERRTNIKVLVFSLSAVLLVWVLSPLDSQGVQSSQNYQDAQRGSRMFEKSRCNTCHVVDPAGRILNGELTASVTVLCGRCHDDIFTKGYTHPVNMRPRTVRVPGDMPLSEGSLSCCTCHDIHSSFLTPYGAHTYYLRRGEIGKEFCSICHSGKRPRSAGHRGTLGKAHLSYEPESTGSSRAIDPISQDCISCHDGATATSIPIRVGSTIRAGSTVSSTSLRSDMENHPIGVDYEAARVGRKRSMSDLRPMAMVDPRIHFFDGKIGCGSCHDPYSTIESQLVMSDRRSSLCLSCHVMDRGF